MPAHALRLLASSFSPVLVLNYKIPFALAVGVIVNWKVVVQQFEVGQQTNAAVTICRYA